MAEQRRLAPCVLLRHKGEVESLCAVVGVNDWLHNKAIRDNKRVSVGTMWLVTRGPTPAE